MRGELVSFAPDSIDSESGTINNERAGAPYLAFLADTSLHSHSVESMQLIAATWHQVGPLEAICFTIFVVVIS